MKVEMLTDLQGMSVDQVMANCREKMVGVIMQLLVEYSDQLAKEGISAEAMLPKLEDYRRRLTVQCETALVNLRVQLEKSQGAHSVH